MHVTRYFAPLLRQAKQSKKIIQISRMRGKKWNVVDNLHDNRVQLASVCGVIMCHIMCSVGGL